MEKLSPTDALREAVSRIGSQSATGRLLGVTQAAVWGWLNEGKPLPAEHVLLVERETGIPKEVLRPDIYPATPGEGQAVFEPLR